MLYDFCPVKKETAFRVLSVIALNENLSRKEIAESCGLSKVTAGKIVDFLACKGIVAEHTRAESSGAGPHSLCVLINPRYNCLVTDLYSKNFTTDIVSLREKRMAVIPYSYDNRRFPDDNLRLYLRDVLKVQQKFSPGYCIGVGLIMPDSSSMGEEVNFADGVSSRDTAVNISREILSPKRIVTGNKIELTLKYLLSSKKYSNKSSIIYICLTDKGIRTAALINNTPVYFANGRYADIGSVRLRGRKSVDFQLTHSKSPEEYADAVAFACANAIFFYAPDVIILDSEIHKHIVGLREMVISSLTDYYAIGEKIIPQIACPDKSSYAFASLGIMCALRERFIYETTERFFEEKKFQKNGNNETSGQT